MRMSALIIGILLLIVGGLISAGLLSISSEETVAKVGPLELTTKQEKKPDAVFGYVLLGAGVLVLVAGLATRK
jgi:hypothetical protein